MKRRLMDAYDRISMPEDCTRRIEQKLRQEMESRQSGGYTRRVPPSEGQHRSWAVAVCLLLVLCLSGGALLFQSEIPVTDDPAYATAATSKPEVTEPARSMTPADHYGVATDFSAEEVEAFALEARKNLLEGNWEAFAKQVQYPVTIEEKIVTGDGGLAGLFIRNKVDDAFLEEIRKESCETMFCNWQGICMGSGQIWINEVDGQLKITAINNLFGELVDVTDFHFTEIGQGRQAIAGYAGMAEEVTFPSGRNGDVVTRIGTESPVIWNGKFVKSIRIPPEVTEIGDRAFGDCEGLETVFFQGDAPACGADIFEGSGNVTVYYPEGTSGWTNPWCGRPALPYETGHISLGTVQISTKSQEEAYRLYDSILRGTQKIEFPEWNTQYTIAQYCDRRRAETGKQVTCTQFTLVDMDDDGIKELILRLRPEGEPLDDYLILRYESGSNLVYCYAELRQMISGLKKDGAFFWEKDNARWVASLKELNSDAEEGLSVLEAAQKSPVRWHSLSIVDPAWVLDSYVIIAEEARGEVLGGQFFYFEQLITGKVDSDWKTLQEHLQLNGFRCEAKNGSVVIYDPASPGCVMFGTLDEESQLDSLGYYVCDETGERIAEVRNLHSDAPEYRVEMNLIWEQETLGKPVSTPEEVLQYIRN